MWAKFINIILGIWLMVAPTILDHGPAASDNGHIIGPIIVTFSTISLWEATDTVRKWNYPFALWLLLAPWFLGYGLAIACVSDVLVGVAVIILSAVKGKMKYRFGGGWSSLMERNPQHLENQRDNKQNHVQ